MKKKIFFPAAVLLVSAGLLTACSSASDTKVTESSQTKSETQTTAETTASSEKSYAWLGLEDMPKCDYLDILATNHYYRVYDAYVSSFKTETKEAVDGVNTYSETESTRSYSVEGKILSINERSKIYMEEDVSASIEVAKKNLKEAMEKGTNMTGRKYKAKGEGAVPLYSNSGDVTKYEYYEYTYPASESKNMSITERFYIKDGDVFAVYKKTTLSGGDTETVDVIKSMSGDIPEGTFDTPDLEGYKNFE